MSQFTDDVINWMQGTFGQSGNGFFDLFSTLGGPTGWLLVLAVVLRFGGSRMGHRVDFAMSIFDVMNPLLKWAIAQPRPYYESDAIQSLKASDGLGCSRTCPCGNGC